MITRIIIAVTIVALTITTAHAENTSNLISPEVEKAALAGDWKQITRLLKNVDSDSGSPVERMIKGHADLAQNKNDEAACLFMSGRSAPANKAWDEWTEQVVQNHPGNAMAHYFRGDALSRNGQWKPALVEFDSALKTLPNYALAFNAKGVVHASTGELRLARVDFEEAIKHSKNNLADPYANIGALSLQRKDGAQGGMNAFNKALDISPDFSLALHGRGYVSIVLAGNTGNKKATQQITQAKEDFQRSDKLSRCEGMSMLFLANRTRYSAFRDGMKPKEYLALLANGGKAGTTIGVTSTSNSRAGLRKLERQLIAAEANPKGGLFGQWFQHNPINKTIANLPESQKAKAIQMVNEARQRSPEFAKVYDPATREMTRWNPGGGAAHKVNTAYSAVGTITGLGGTIFKNPYAATAAAVMKVHSKTLEFDRAKYLRTSQYISKRLEPIESGKYGGVDTNLSNITWDDGQWPFAGYFTLSYSYNDDDLPLDEMRKTVEKLAVAERKSKDKISESQQQK